VAAAALISLVATACMEGKRPYFEQAPTAVGTSTGDPNIDAVLAIAESARGAERMRAAISQLPWTGASRVSAVVEAPQLLAPSLMALADRARLRASYERAIAESKR
jgi:hypothetical protein